MKAPTQDGQKFSKRNWAFLILIGKYAKYSHRLHPLSLHVLGLVRIGMDFIHNMQANAVCSVMRVDSVR